MYKFTGFTQKANDVLNAAIEYAENMGHTYIGSEHLFLALMREGAVADFTLLAQRRVTAGKAELALLHMVGRGQPTLL